MANKKKDDLDNKISIATYGLGGNLDKNDTRISSVVKQTAKEITTKYSPETGPDSIIDRFTSLSLDNAFNRGGKKGTQANNDAATVNTLKSLMQDNAGSAITLLSAESNRTIDYSNYRAIYDNIPECATALGTYVSNILSPDDYTKSIFTVYYRSLSATTDDADVTNKLKDLVEKYELEDKTEEIVTEVLKVGDCYVSVLPYNTEIAKMLSGTKSGILTESANFNDLDKKYHYSERMLNESVDIATFSDLNDKELQALNEMFVFSDDDESKQPAKVSAETLEENVAKLINENVHVRSVTELYESRLQADSDFSVFDKKDIDNDKVNKLNGKVVSKNKLMNKKFEDLHISGSRVQMLESDRVVELTVDGINYGYFYIEPGFNGTHDYSMNANMSKIYMQTSNPMNPSLTPQGTGQPRETSGNPVAKNLNISDEKLQLISGVFLKGIGKKLNKKYIQDNKQFKDIIFSLLKQRYLLENGIGITYFLPSEVVAFKTESIYKNIVYFAKLYLANLTNLVLIKLGRGHDKRVFYVNAGLDNNHEQAIAKVIQDVKTKEFKLSNIGSISSILSLNPGAFDDYYIPQINGEKPVDIETIQGMDQDLNNDFMAFLRKSMVEGTGVPSAILELSENVDFARQITTQNANFCRKIIRIQKQLTKPFNEFIRRLYVNEYAYTVDSSENALNNIDIKEIKIQFPSPGTLNMSNMAEQFAQARAVAEEVAKSYIPEKMDQTTADQITFYTEQFIREFLPHFDWERFDKIAEDAKTKFASNKITDKTRRKKDGTDDQQMGGY